jgi:transcriptional regulator with XRE-family HTH domain
MAFRMAPHPAVLGLRVLTLMHQRGLSIPQLARQSGVALAAVQRIVAGKSHEPSVWTLVAFANVLDVSLDYLTGRTDAPEGQREADACAPEASLATSELAPARDGVPAGPPGSTAPAPPPPPGFSPIATTKLCPHCGGVAWWEDNAGVAHCVRCSPPPLRQGPLLRQRP